MPFRFNPCETCCGCDSCSGETPNEILVAISNMPDPDPIFCAGDTSFCPDNYNANFVLGNRYIVTVSETVFCVWYYEFPSGKACPGFSSNQNNYLVLTLSGNPGAANIKITSNEVLPGETGTHIYRHVVFDGFPTGDCNAWDEESFTGNQTEASCFVQNATCLVTAQ